MLHVPSRVFLLITAIIPLLTEKRSTLEVMEERRQPICKNWINSYESETLTHSDCKTANTVSIPEVSLDYSDTK